ncbi:MAG: hypothetical protein SPG48_12870 [Treponema sp.]|nr:hypothetical protein [Treponema sp.]
MKINDKLYKAFGKLFCLILILFSIFVSSACKFPSGSGSSDSFEQKNEFITVRGSIGIKGAVPSICDLSDSDALASGFDSQSKSALPSLPDSLVYSVTATSASGETVSSSQIVDGIFELKLTAGKWSLSAEIRSGGELILTGTTTGILITTEKPIVDDIVIIARPLKTSGETGTVKLAIARQADTQIKSMTAIWSQNGLETSQLLNFTADSVDFTMNAPVESGSYNVKFMFFSDIGMLLYSCSETVNVFAGLCTDCWKKDGTSSSSPYLLEIDGKTEFKLTKQTVDAFVQSVLYVQGTGGSYTPVASASDTNNGTYFAPLSTVQAAVDKIVQINDGSTEYSIFIDGTVTAPDSLDSSVTLNFVKIDPQKTLNLTIASLSSAQAVINANKKAGVMYVLGKNADEKTTLVLQNICLTGGKTQYTGVGGGLKAEYSEITLKSGTVIGTKLLPDENGSSDIATSSNYGNFAAKGGGIYLNGCALTIENGAYICQNYSQNEGGGIAAEGSSNIISNGGIIGFNQASFGGGIYITDGSAELTDCTVSLNKANSNGGGLYVENGSLAIKNAKINYNYSTIQTSGSGSGGGLKLAGNASMTIESDSEIAYNGSAFTGAGIELTGTSSCTMNAGSIHDNKNNIYSAEKGLGAGVCIASGTTFTMNGGKIYGNMYNNQTLHKFGDAIYVAGTLNLSADACIAPDNDVYLESGTFVTVTGKLTGTLPVATLTPDSYEENRIMIKGGSSYNLVSSDCKLLSVTENSAENKMYSVVLDSPSNSGILKEAKTVVSPELSGVRFIPSTNFVSSNLLQTGEQTVSFVVQKKVISADGETFEYTDCNMAELSNCYIALVQNDCEILSGNKTLVIKTWVPEGKYSLYMSATVDDVEYSAWETFVIASKIPISSLTSAPDSKYYPHLAAETGEDLKKLNEWMQDGSTMEGITITLTKDIDLTSETEWQPIGDATKLDTYTGVPFKGTINGNGNTIKLAISSEAQTCIGLVKINEGIIENLVIEQYSQNGITFGDSDNNASRGGAICVNNRGIIRNCVNKANLKAYTYWGVAGICMINYGTVENCLNTGNIEMVKKILWAGEWIYSSGIAAENFGSIINCVNTGKIIAQQLRCGSNHVNNFSGAIAARLCNTEDTSADISNCYWLKNSVTRNGTDVNECVTIVEQNITWEGSAIHVNSIPDPSKITGCGYFNDFSASAPLTAGDEASCKTAQTLSYGTTLLEALNGYVSANSGRELKQWQASADGSITIGF